MTDLIDMSWSELVELGKKQQEEIERLRLEFYHYENENTYKGNSIRHWYNKAMAYGKGLDEANSEIERLRAARDMFVLKCSELTDKNTKLQAVVERIATRDYDETAQEFARAALEEVDDDT